MKISPSLATVESAFAEIGINATTSADEYLPQGVIAIFLDHHDLKLLKAIELFISERIDTPEIPAVRFCLRPP